MGEIGVGGDGDHGDHEVNKGVAESLYQVNSLSNLAIVKSEDAPLA